MILVVGGTGRLGSLLVRALCEHGERVRVLTRDRARATGLPAAVELAIGDACDADAVRSAVIGCRTVVSAMHGFAGTGGSPETIDRDANCALIRAATAAGVSHFVLVSVHDARPDHPMTLHRAKFAAETALRASALAATIIRPTAFLETWMSIIGEGIGARGQALVFGSGQNPINFVSVRDVAALVVLAVRDENLRGETLEIGGPEDLGFTTLAQRLIDASGKPGRVKHIPLPVLRAMSVLSRPFSAEFARKARAAVVMNTRDMTLASDCRGRFPALPTTALANLLEPITSP